MDKALTFVWRAAPRHTMLCTCLLVLQGLVPLASIYVFKLIVDHISGRPENLVAGQYSDHLILLVMAASGIALLGNLSNAILGHASAVQAHLVSDFMQRVVQTKSIEMGLSYYENSQFFDKLHRAQREAPSRPLRIVQGLSSVGRNSISLVGAFAVLLSFHWAIVAAVLVTSVPAIFFRIKHADGMYELERELTIGERLSRYLNDVLTTADHAKEVRVFGFGPMMIRRFADIRNNLRIGMIRVSTQGHRRQFLSESIATVAGYGSLAFIAHQALIGTITLGGLVMYFGAFQVAIGSLRPTLSSLAELYENNLFLSSLFEFLELPKDVTDQPHPKPIPKQWHSGVRVENLTFRYPGTCDNILDRVHLTIAPGEIVAIVGRNGSGKTTLTKLLCRLYDPTEGRITIDGVDVRDFQSEEYRSQISVIYQDYGQYHLSARENILLGSPDLARDDPAIFAAAKWANIHTELMALPRGYDTVMSRSLADGHEFSGGQWQKLALARAFVRKSQLVILDEPTSSLDAAAEFEFFEQFRTMAQGRSALIISHRFSTVSLATRVYVLDRGRVIEEGTHDELLAADGVYANLYRKQASHYVGESGTAAQSS
ncbi:MAG: ABC transporter ATP-binding protein [Sterolibacteriaceae bacterium]|nr:ABC transporter ATP-binding protein [Candidatus Methylophosphatis haderslevensis]